MINQEIHKAKLVILDHLKVIDLIKSSSIKIKTKIKNQQ